MNTGQAIDFSGPCSWIPGSRAKPAPWNDNLSAFFSSLLAKALLTEKFAAPEIAVLAWHSTRFRSFFSMSRFLAENLPHVKGLGQRPRRPQPPCLFVLSAP